LSRLAFDPIEAETTDYVMAKASERYTGEKLAKTPSQNVEKSNRTGAWAGDTDRNRSRQASQVSKKNCSLRDIE
jgi:hypothetical protein